MYCGSCLRDNALARAIIRCGRDVQLVPTYTPLTTDEAGAAIDRVFLGGINVYLQQRIGLLRYLPRWLDRWLSHPRLLRRFTAGPRRTDPRRLGDLTLSVLRGTSGRQAKEFRHLVEWIVRQRPDVVDLSNLLIAGCLPELRRRLDIPLLVTLQGDDLFLDKLPAAHREPALQRLRELSRLADGLIVYTEFYRRRVQELFELPEERLHTVPLGIDTTDFAADDFEGERQVDESAAAGRNETSRPMVGYLARLCPEKGFDRFVDLLLALRRLPGLEGIRGEALGSWGDEGLEYIERQRARVAQAGADPELLAVHVHATRAEKLAFLRRIDCLCVPTRYEEPKGLYVLEALAAGVPVVLPAHGAFPELIGALGGGLLVPPDDLEGAVRAVAGLLRDGARRAELGARGRRAVLQHRSSDAMARATLRVYDALVRARFESGKGRPGAPALPEKEGKTC